MVIANIVSVLVQCQGRLVKQTRRYDGMETGESVKATENGRELLRPTELRARARFFPTVAVLGATSNTTKPIIKKRQRRRHIMWVPISPVHRYSSNGTAQRRQICAGGATTTTMISNDATISICEDNSEITEYGGELYRSRHSRSVVLTAVDLDSQMTYCK